MSSSQQLRNLVVGQKNLGQCVLQLEKRKTSNEYVPSNTRKSGLVNDSLQARMEYYSMNMQSQQNHTTNRSNEQNNSQTGKLLWQKRPSLNKITEKKQIRTEEDQSNSQFSILKAQNQIFKLKGLLNKTLHTTKLGQKAISISKENNKSFKPQSYEKKQQKTSATIFHPIQQLVQQQVVSSIKSTQDNKNQLMGSQSERTEFKKLTINPVSQRMQTSDQQSHINSPLKLNLKQIPSPTLNLMLQSFKHNLASPKYKHSSAKKPLHSFYIKELASFSPQTIINKPNEQSKTKLDQILDATLVINNFPDMLTNYERKEILEYKSIYYFGQNAKKKFTLPDKADINFGYDNERGDYLYLLNDHVAYRYEILERIGKGSFGQAFRVYDYKRKVEVALKVIRNKRKFHSQALIEIQILKVLREFDTQSSSSLVKIKDYLIFRNHVCIVLELLSMNLYEFLHQNKFHGISLDLIRRFSIQLLQALMMLEQQRIIHCDLKPENILLKEPNKSGIKVIDFGSSCFEDEKLYSYIQSRFYRAPEIILGTSYGLPIDMWSFGCIMTELFIGSPMFPSESEKDHMSMMLEVLGMPPQPLIESCTKRSIYFENDFTPKPFTTSKGKVRQMGSRPLTLLLANSGENFTDFVASCLSWDQADRMKPAEALVHLWILEGLPEQIKEQHLQQMKLAAPYLCNHPNIKRIESKKMITMLQDEIQQTLKVSQSLSPPKVMSSSLFVQNQLQLASPYSKNQNVKKNSFFQKLQQESLQASPLSKLTSQGVQGESIKIGLSQRDIIMTSNRSGQGLAIKSNITKRQQ